MRPLFLICLALIGAAPGGAQAQTYAGAYAATGPNGAVGGYAESGRSGRGCPTVRRTQGVSAGPLSVGIAAGQGGVVGVTSGPGGSVTVGSPNGAAVASSSTTSGGTTTTWTSGDGANCYDSPRSDRNPHHRTPRRK